MHTSGSPNPSPGRRPIPPPFETVVRSQADLTDLWLGLMGPGGFGRRSLWLVYLDAQGRLQPAITPVDDVPEQPGTGDAERIATLLADLLSGSRDLTAAMLLSRPGPAAMTGADRLWARALLRSCDPAIMPWPLHLATRDRIQLFAPDDLVVPSHSA